MIKAKVNNNKEYSIDFEGDDLSRGKINEEDFKLDILKEKKGVFHIIKNNKSYNVNVLKFDQQKKSMTLLINGKKHEVVLRNQYDELLASLGMDVAASIKVNEIKAPMPGLVLDIIIEEGSEVKTGDALIVLEAMKMENILKSPADGKVEKIAVEKGMAVEKDQVLINFSS